MKLKLELHKEEFKNNGLTIITGVFPLHDCQLLVDRAMSLDPTIIKSLDCTKGSATSKPYEIRHQLIDGHGIKEHLPELKTMYHALLPLLACITEMDVIIGGWEQSDVNLIIYEPGSLKGKHFDTVPVTTVIPLTTATKNKGQFHYVDLFGKLQKYMPVAGDVILFQGKKIEHWPDLKDLDSSRLVVNSNYYLVDDHQREPYIDKLMFE